jgi:hypothetical protein
MTRRLDGRGLTWTVVKFGARSADGPDGRGRRGLSPGSGAWLTATVTATTATRTATGVRSTPSSSADGARAGVSLFLVSGRSPVRIRPEARVGPGGRPPEPPDVRGSAPPQPPTGWCRRRGLLVLLRRARRRELSDLSAVITHRRDPRSRCPATAQALRPQHVYDLMGKEAMSGNRAA